jgi:hypothetical protein
LVSLILVPLKSSVKLRFQVMAAWLGAVGASASRSASARIGARVLMEGLLAAARREPI